MMYCVPALTSPVIPGGRVAGSAQPVLPRHRRRPRGLAALSAWAFGEIGFHRLDLVHSVANTASCRVAAKVGFAAEGVQRSAVLHADGWHDMHVHARISGDEQSSSF